MSMNTIQMSPETVEQMVKMERDLIREMVADEVDKRLVAIEDSKQSQSWNPVTLLTGYLSRPTTRQRPTASHPTSPIARPPNPTPTQEPTTMNSEEQASVPAFLFEAFINAYPHYSMDPWEFNLGVLAAIQMLRASAITFRAVDCYIGMIPTYRHLSSQVKAGMRARLPEYTEFVDMVLSGAGYDEGVVTVDLLKRFVGSEEGKEIRDSFLGFRDECLGIGDVGSR